MRQCVEPGCMAPVKTRGRCVGHGRGAIAAALVAAVLERDGHRCFVCWAVCPHPKHHEVDHVEAWVESRGHDVENLQTLCAACHAAKTRRDRGGEEISGADRGPVRAASFPRVRTGFPRAAVRRG